VESGDFVEEYLAEFDFALNPVYVSGGGETDW
jgi:hypothetical protein